MICHRSPLRMSFVGGGSDLPSYYQDRPGAVLSTAINKYVYVIVNSKFEDNYRISYSKTENVSRICDIEHPIVRNSLKFLDIKKGLEIVSISDIPGKGSGLGSSSAFTVALLSALRTFKNMDVAPEILAQNACHIEMCMCQEPIGKQDQYASAYGGFNVIKFSADDKVEVSPVKIKRSDLCSLQDNIIMLYTGKTRRSSSVLNSQSKNTKRPGSIRNLDRMVQLVAELKRVIELGDLDEFGPILHENWCLKRELADGISNSDIDEIYQAGLAAGASGGKLLGAGNGGFMMFYAPKNRHDKILKSLNKLRRVPFNFEPLGVSQIY